MKKRRVRNDARKYREYKLRPKVPPIYYNLCVSGLSVLDELNPAISNIQLLNTSEKANCGCLPLVFISPTTKGIENCINAKGTTNPFSPGVLSNNLQCTDRENLHFVLAKEANTLSYSLMARGIFVLQSNTRRQCQLRFRC